MKKKILTVLIIAVCLVLALVAFASNPVILSKADLPENYLEAIESQSKGLYSNKLPLVPIYIMIEEFSEGVVYYTIHYFPFGTVGMSYTSYDGYNIEKPLTGL